MNAPVPPIEKSAFIAGAEFEEVEHLGTGDMWPLTWGSDGNLYAGAGDNRGIPATTFSPMNVFVVEGTPESDLAIREIHHLPIDPRLYCRGILVDANYGVKPAGLLSMDGVLYMSVENINYGDNPRFNRQHNLNGWIIVSEDNGKSWDTDATFQTFFAGRTASAHFLQFGRDYAQARDEYVYTYFPCASDAQSYWCNNDCILLGRAPKDRLRDRLAWEFVSGLDAAGNPSWNSDDMIAAPVFSAISWGTTLFTTHPESPDRITSRPKGPTKVS